MLASHRTNARDEPLTLVLYPSTMDMRRLHCLVVGSHGTCHEIHVSGRDMRVVALQFKLSSQLGGGLCANDLELFLARPPTATGNDWLLSQSEEALELADVDANRLCTVGSAFIMDSNMMSPMSLLHSYFPVQPSLYEGRRVAIHVLVCIPKLLLPFLPPPLSPLAITGEEPKKRKPAKEKKAETVSKLAALLVNWKKAKIELVCAPRVPGESNVLPQLMRCVEPGDQLWLSATEDDGALTEIYIPTPWRLLRDAIISWLEDPLNEADAPVELWNKGRRALLTGAPGIGKSVFLVYVLMCIVRTKKPPVCIVDVPGVTFTLIDPKKGVVIDGQREVDFATELADPFTVYLFDTSAAMPDVRPLGPNRVDARTIAISPQRFVPMSTRRTKTFVLPQWTIGDVRKCVRLWVPPKVASEVISLYHKWGGIPGRLFGVLPTTSTAELELAVGELKPSKVAKMLMAISRETGWLDVAHGPDADLWKPLVVLASDPTSDSFEHDGQVAFTSQYVCDRVMELLTMRTSSIGQYQRPKLSRLWDQIRSSLSYLAQEEEEKSNESPTRLKLFPKSKSKPTFGYWT